MEIIDTHVHVFPAVAAINNGQPLRNTSFGHAMIGNREVQFLPPAFENTTCSVEMLIAYMDWCGISRAILMANPYYGFFNDYFIESVKKYPDRLRAVSLVDVAKGKEAADELEKIFRDTPLFGMKIETYSSFQCAPGLRMTDPSMAPVWEVMDRGRQPLFIHMFIDNDVEDVKALIAKYRQMPVVLCHMGADACHGKGVRETNFEECIALVHDHENVYFDTSSVSVYFEEEYPYPGTVEIIERGWRAVGAEKLLWASDFPGMLTRATLRQLINIVAKECKNIPEKDKQLILGGNARRLFFSE